MAESSTALPGDILSIRNRKKADAEEKVRMARRDRRDRAEGGLGQGSGGVPLTKSSPVPPKPKLKPAMPATNSDTKVVAASDKSRTAPKMTAFQRQKARQFEKEGVAGRSMTRAQAQRKATEKGSGVSGLSKLFGISKTPKASQKKSESKRSGQLKSAFAQISYQGRKK